MKLSDKLDMLQKMHRKAGEDPYVVYMLSLLAEHAEEAEMAPAFLAWVEGMLTPSA